VISNHKLAAHGLIWVAMITSTDNKPWPSDVAITDLKRAGFTAPSVVRPAKIACIEPARIDRRVGRLDKAAARAVGQSFATFLVTGFASLNPLLTPCYFFIQETFSLLSHRRSTGSGQSNFRSASEVLSMKPPILLPLLKTSLTLLLTTNR